MPVNLDQTYADDSNDPTVKLHQQFHDLIHGFVPPIGFDGSARGAIDTAYLLLTTGPFWNTNSSTAIAPGDHIVGLSAVRGGLLSSVSCVVTTAVAGAVVNLSLFRPAADGFAGMREHTWQFSAASTGLKTITGLSTVIRPGWYWVGLHAALANTGNVELLSGMPTMAMGHRVGLYERNGMIGIERQASTPMTDATASPITGGGFGTHSYQNIGVPLLYWRTS